RGWVPPRGGGCGGWRHPPQIQSEFLKYLNRLPITHQQPTILNPLYKPHQPSVSGKLYLPPLAFHHPSLRPLGPHTLL
ncbi:MAG: hypothetical protein PVF83_19245, partial [Anaerolineales bacterium]